MCDAFRISQSIPIGQGAYMSQNNDQMLQITTRHLGKLLNDVIAESPRVAQALQSIRADGYDVLMHVEVSLALKQILPNSVPGKAEKAELSEVRTANA